MNCKNRRIKFEVKSKHLRSRYNKSIYDGTMFCRKYTVYESLDNGGLIGLFGTDSKYEFLMLVDMYGFKIGNEIKRRTGCYRVFEVIQN